MGIEPTSSAWKAEVLPLNYTRLFCLAPYIRSNDSNCLRLAPNTGLNRTNSAFIGRAKILTVCSH